jgi:uncharacterized membrane-anchored protein
MNRKRMFAFSALVATLVLVPLGLIAWNEYRLSSGDRVVLLVQPVDPNDPFRGEYVDLTYPISRLDTRGAEPGTTVYVPLRKRGQVWTGDHVVRERPEEGTFIRGRVANFGVRYGIETFFVEEGQARKYERAIAERRLYAEVVLDDDGGGQLDELVIGDRANAREN